MAAKSPKDLRTPEIRTVPIGKVKPWGRNPRKGHAVDRIVRSIEEFGYLQPVVVQRKTYRLLAGHGRLEALKKSGAKKIPVIIADLPDGRAEAFAIADNRAGDLSDWDGSKLADVLGGLEKDLQQAAGYTEREIENLLEAAMPEAVEDDAPPAPPGKPVTEGGDVWELDRHLVGCCDSLDGKALNQLRKENEIAAVVTDPPYAIYGSSTGIASDITDDKIVRPYFEALFRLCESVLPWFGHAYTFCDWRTWPAIWESARRTAMSSKNCIVWDKGGGGLGTNYMLCYELIGFFSKLPAQNAMGHRKSGQRQVHRPNIMRYERVKGKDRHHNAAKPVPLLAELIQNSTDKGAWILDPFGGSGSTLIAAEKTARRCLMVDLEPKWVDVTVSRWQALTGKRAKNLTRAKAVIR